MAAKSLFELETERERVKIQLADLGDLRPGSLVGRYRKCGKPNCHCAKPGEAGHGPSWSLTHDSKGKTVTKVIPPDLVPRTREQLAEYQRLRGLTRDLVEVSEKICDAQLLNQTSEGVKKKLQSPRNWPTT